MVYRLPLEMVEEVVDKAEEKLKELLAQNAGTYDYPELDERTVAPSLDTYLNVVRQSGGSVENVDVWPTLLDLLGLPPLPDAQGRSLLPAIEAAYRGERDPAGALDASASKRRTTVTQT